MANFHTKVTVVDDKDGLPLASAKVTHGGQYAGDTDENGIVEFECDSKTTYDLWVEKSGYTSKKEKLAGGEKKTIRL